MNDGRISTESISQGSKGFGLDQKLASYLAASAAGVLLTSEAQAM